MFRYDNITLRDKAEVEFTKTYDLDEAMWVLEMAMHHGLVDIEKAKTLKGKKLLTEVFSFLSEYDVLNHGIIVKKSWTSGDDWRPFIINAKDLLEDLSYNDALAIRMGLYLLYAHHGLHTPQSADYIFDIMPELIEIEECHVKFEEDGAMTDEYIQQVECINIKKYFTNFSKICVPIYPCTYQEYYNAAKKVKSTKAKNICRSLSNIFEIGLNLDDMFGVLRIEDSDVQFYGMIVYMDNPELNFLKNYSIRSDYSTMTEFIGEGPGINTLILKTHSNKLFESFYNLMSK